MKKFIASIAIIVALTGMVHAKEIKMTAAESKKLIAENASNPDFIIIDIRTPDEYAAGHVDGAVNIDFYGDSFESELSKLDKNKSYLVYCRSGRRSASSMEIFDSLGFKTIYHMVNGFITF